MTGIVLQVLLNGERLPIKSFAEYVGLYVKDADAARATEKCNRWEVVAMVSEGHPTQVRYRTSLALVVCEPCVFLPACTGCLFRLGCLVTGLRVVTITVDQVIISSWVSFIDISSVNLCAGQLRQQHLHQQGGDACQLHCRPDI